VAHAPLHTEGIDATRIEEVRIVLIGRPAGADPAAAKRQALLCQLVDAGRLGAWYTLADGPVAEVLLASGLPGLPVSSAEGRVLGFVSRSDLLRAIVADPPLDLWS
jgi:CBS domain-containing protein